MSASSSSSSSSSVAIEDDSIDVITPGAAAAVDDTVRTFKTVFIPCDSTRPIAEWIISYTAATEVSCILDRLKPHFASYGVSAIDAAAMRASVRTQIADTLAKQNPAAAKQPVEDSMVDMILNMSAIDCVPLQNNKSSTGYIGLMLYVDDQGRAKSLPLNHRASNATLECGAPTSVLGDALIARNFDDEDAFRRIDFSVAEFETDRRWKDDARKAKAEMNTDENATKAAQLKAMLKQSGVNVSDTLSSSTPAATSTVRECSAMECKNAGKLRCARCKSSYYCSAPCQKKDWPFHKANVCAIAAAATTTATSSTTATKKDETKAMEID